MEKESASIVPVLMYHHVTPSKSSLNCSPKNFEAQMAHLSNRGYTALTAKQFAGFLRGEPVPPKSVLLTFDDGWLDNYVYAYPILKKYDMHAILFLITGWAHTGDARPCIDGSQALPYCPGHEECKQMVVNGRSDDVIVRWEEARLMQTSQVMEIHSHTHTHIRWDKQLNTEGKNNSMTKELEQSRTILREQMGRVSEHLCWPQGYFDADYISIAQQAGFNILYTTDPYGFNVPGMALDHVHRFAVRNRGGLWFGWRLWLARTPRLGAWYHRYKAWRKHQREQHQARKEQKH